jgi:cyclic 2,3-diphosphoglycerate synthetase
MAGVNEGAPPGAAGPAGGGSIVLIDGEHYPPVTARAVGRLQAAGERLAAALLVGGSEKLDQVPLELGIPVERVSGGAPEAEAALARLLRATGARAVIDLSDDPVLNPRARTRMASVALWCGATYTGPDFRFTPPDRSLALPAPSVAVIGMGKRVGKTALGGAVARVYRGAGLDPVVIAMGRGGPAEPDVVAAGEQLDPDRLVALATAGRHAASDYLEDALTAGVPTVGAWRAGGGLAGGVAHSNLPAAVARASALRPGLIVLEGSGASVPPAAFDAGILVVDSGSDPELLCGYFGLYRLLLADLVVLTMCEEPPYRQSAPAGTRESAAAIERCARSTPLSRPNVVCTVFRPHPLADISGKKIWFGTTADERAGPILKQHLEGTYGCEVVAVSHALARRDDLRRELESAWGTGGSRPVDALVVELKAAAVDVVARWGLERGLEVVFVDNRPQAVGGDGPLEELFLRVAEAARERFQS